MYIPIKLNKIIFNKFINLKNKKSGNVNLLIYFIEDSKFHGILRLPKADSLISKIAWIYFLYVIKK